MKQIKSTFLNYLQFDLYELEKNKHGLAIKIKDGNKPNINYNFLSDFHRQITDNTDYIIHPDEIIADNFTLLILAEGKPKELEKISPLGKELLLKINHILKK